MATHDEAAKVEDIEMQLLNTTLRSDQSTPPTTNAESDNDNKLADVEDAESVVNNPTTTTSSATTTDPASSMSEDIFLGILYTSILILLLPLLVVYLILSVCISGELKDPDELFSRKKTGDHQKGVYLKMLHFESTKQKFQRLNVVIVTRVGCLALLWFVVNISVSSLKSVMLFQYPLWKWTLLAVVILLGYPVTLLTTCILFALIMFFREEVLKQPNFYLEYALLGLRDSLISLLHFVAILVMWLCYFRTSRGLNPSERLDKFGTGTFVSLLIGAILWVLKSVALLKWKSNAVHKRFEVRILIAGLKLYFLALIIDGVKLGKSLLPWRVEYYKYRQTLTQAPSRNIVSDGTTKDGTNLCIKDFISSNPAVSVHEIDTVATHVTDLTKVTPRDNDGIPEVVAKCQEKIPAQNLWDTVQYITEQALKENFGLCEDDAQLLLQELKGEQMSDEITYDTFQKWMVDAHKNCLSVGYTLIDAFAVVSMLNRVLTGFIIVVVILVWLLITGLATTKVLVLIASPFLTFSFMFGDTCKTFFQGIIFSFVTHPYDVGDRCIIEGIELEVKRIGVLITTFLKIGTKEEIIYPNASLATKLITNLKGEPDPSDTIELILDSFTTKLKILGLMEDLVSFFESTDRDGSYEKKIHLAVKEIGSSIKVSISFTHVMNVHDVSHSQCLQKKNKQRSELLIEIKQFLEDREIKLATP